MNSSAEGIACEVGSPSAGGAFVPLALGDSMLLGIPELDTEHQRLVDLANVIVSPENEVVPALLLVRIREFFGLFKHHMQNEVVVLAALGIPDLDDLHHQHDDAIESFEMFLATCEDVNKKFPWTPRSLRQIFQCFLAHAIEADVKVLAGRNLIPVRA